MTPLLKSVLSVLLVYITFSSRSQTISAGGNAHSLAICTSGTVKSWGVNFFGQLGNGNYTDSNVPVNVSSLTNVIAVAAGDVHSLALKADGTLWSWGHNDNGQLGNGTTTSSNIPVHVSTLTGITAIEAGVYQSYALKNDGTVWAWGGNHNGQLGNGTAADTNLPVQMAMLTNIVAISCNGNGSFGLAIKNDGTVWSWGSAADGELGTGFTSSDAYTPVQIPTLTGITKISAGDGHSLFLKSDSTVWVCGFNFNGQLGNGTYTSSYVPIQVNPLTGITGIYAGAGNCFAQKKDGGMWVWGENYGLYGDGTTVNSIVPEFISSLTQVNNIVGDFGHTMILKNDGTIWTSGSNDNGQLGNGNNTDSNVLVNVTGMCPALTIGIDEVTADIDFSLYPNPASNLLNIKVPAELKATALFIYSSKGTLVYSGSYTTQMNVSPFSSGVYFLVIPTKSGILRKGFVVEHQ